MQDLAKKYVPQTSGWFQMKELGDYRIRVVTELYPYQRAPFRAGEDPKTGFLCRILDRADNTIKLWSMQYSIYQQYLGLAQDNDYTFDDTPDYDLKIKKISTGPEKMNVAYQLFPAPTSPLTSAESLSLEAENDIEQVLETVKKKELEKIRSQVPTGVPAPQGTVTPKTPSMVQPGDPGYVAPEDIPF